MLLLKPSLWHCMSPRERKCPSLHNILYDLPLPPFWSYLCLLSPPVLPYQPHWPRCSFSTSDRLSLIRNSFSAYIEMIIWWGVFFFFSFAGLWSSSFFKKKLYWSIVALKCYISFYYKVYFHTFKHWVWEMNVSPFG